MKLTSSVPKIISVVGFVGISSLSLSFLPIQKLALAQSCNVFGCSQPGAGQCNVFGCPNPGAAACTTFGCPSAPVNTNPPPSSNSTQSPSNSLTRTFTVRNNTNQSIQSLYLSSSSESSWGASDIRSTLFNGNSVNFTLTGECNWDLRIELANGQALEQMEIDTCLNNSYSFGQ